MSNIVDVSLNSTTHESCLKQINNIGSTVYQNICTGDMSVVRWGSTDWFIVSIVMLTFFSMFFLFISDVRRGV